MEDEVTIKVGIFGETRVGKSSILNRYFNEKFSNKVESSVNCEIYEKMINKGDKEVSLHVWDTMGQERFLSLTSNYFKGLDGIILAYDKSDKQSFDRLGHWIVTIKDSLDINSVCIILVGNKNDLPPEQIVIKTDMGENYAKANNFLFIETSAKTGEHLTEMFDKLVEGILDKKEKMVKETKLKLKANQAKGKKKCCK